MYDKFVSSDRKKYLRKIKLEKLAVFLTQVRNFAWHHCSLGSTCKFKSN